MVKNDIAYVPLAPAPTSEVIAPTKIDIPTYPDKGVAFAGFSKTLLGQNSYKLNPQEPFDFNIDTVCAGGETGFNYTISTHTGKTHYVTDLFIVAWPNSVNRITLSDPENGKVFFYKLNDNGAQLIGYYVHFSAPIELKNNRMRLGLSAAAAATDEYVINIYGWSE